jgi:tRNA(Ile)-lysidine synthase
MMARAPGGADELSSRFRDHVEREGLLFDGDHVLVALSGGLDSVALLHLLRFHPPVRRLRITAAHLDHRMREGSVADARWTAGLARAWQVPLVSEIAQPVPSGETEARDARYAFLRRVAAERDIRRIATAHHADDQAETVLFRLLRGSGGLHGIPERRGLIVRPLLPFRRSDIEVYATRWRLGWRLDPTNIELDRSRNRIRHIALPALERAMPGAVERLVALAVREREAESAWRTVVRRVIDEVVIERSGGRIQLARKALLGYHRHIRGRVLRTLIGELGGAPGRAATRAALALIESGASGTGVEIGSGLRLERHFDRILIGAPTRRAGPDRTVSIHSPEPGGSSATIGGRHVRVAWSDVRGDSPMAADFDPTALRFPLELRAWRAGDRIRLAGGTRKLKKLFAARRIPRYERGRLPVLAQASDGRVLWVAGVARMAGTEPEAGARVFHIQVSDGNDG